MDKKTTAISTDPFQPREVEWNTYMKRVRQTDGRYRRVEQQKVTLVHPGDALTDRTRLINLSPRTALNLLGWLEENRTTLEQLIKEEE